MAKVLKYESEIATGLVIEEWHVSQMVDAFTGKEAYDITIGGSLKVKEDTIIDGNIVISENNRYISIRDNNSEQTRILGINTSNVTYIGPVDPYAGGSIVYGASGNVAKHSFYGGGTEKVTITPSGNVGIGTTDPQGKLDVNGSIRLQGNNKVYFGSTGQVPYWTVGVQNNTTNNFEIAGNSYYSDAQGSRDILLNPSGNGNVGIGTTSPVTTLDIRGDGVASNPATSGTTVSTGTRFRIASSTNASAVLDLGISTGGKSWLQSTDRSNLSTLYPFLINPNGGNVGIGTTDPQGKLDVNGDIRLQGNNKINLGGTGQVPYWTVGVQNNTTNNFEIAGNSYYSDAQGSRDILLNPSGNGNVGIGTTDPIYKLDVAGRSRISVSSGENSTLQLYNGDGDSYVHYYDESSGGAWSAGSYSTLNGGEFRIAYDYEGGESLTTGTKMVINPNGNVGIGTTNPGTYKFFVNGSAAKPSTSTWVIVSDERVKENIKPYEKGLNEILQVSTKTFDYNGKAGFDKIKDNVGIIAQDIIKIFPETIKTYNAKLNETDEEETELYNFDGHALTFALINSVKELKAEIDKLKKQINK